MLSLTALGLLSTSTVRAQACCAGTGSGEAGLIGPCHDGGVIASLGYRRAVGSYDDEGRLRGLGDASVDDVALSLAAGVRLADRRLLLAGALPLRLQHRRFGRERSVRALPGDASVSIRGMLLRGSLLGFQRGEPDSYLPFIDLLASVRLPTGRPPDRSRDALGADVTGAGTWGLSAGVKVSSFLTLKNSVSASVVWRHSFARDVEAGGVGHRVAAGGALEARLAWTYVPSLFRSAGLFGSFTFARRSRDNGAWVSGSQNHRTSLGGFFTTYLAFPHLELSFFLAVDALWPTAGSNVPFVGPSLTVAISRYFHRRWAPRE